MAIGEWDVDGMLAVMPSKLISEWMAYDRLAPFGPERDDLRAGGIAAVIANVNRNPKDRPKPYGPGDFALRFGPQDDAEETTVDEETPDARSERLLAIAEQLNAAFSGLDLRGETPAA